MLAALVVVTVVAAGVVSHERATSKSMAHGAAAAPPWPAPAGLSTKTDRGDLAGLHNVYGEKLAEHIHSHLSIVIDGQHVAVPGQVGLDESDHFATSLHTHNTSGIIHIESPVKSTFTLGQFFTEWNVRLDRFHVGSAGDGFAESLTVFVDGRRVVGDPAAIVLRDLEDIELVIAPTGMAVHPETAFDWPSNYH